MVTASLDSYYSGSEGEDYDEELETNLDEEKTYELWCSLLVKVKAYFESSSTNGKGRVTSKRANGAGAGGTIIDKEFLKKLSLLTQGLNHPKETGVVMCTVGTEGTYKVLYTALENGLILRWRCKGKKSDLTGVLKGHKGMVTSVLIHSDSKKNKNRSGSNSLPYMVFSGSADSSIKVWDPKSNQRVREGFITEGICVQTLMGHGGTITCMRQVHDYILSGSTDCSVRIWFQTKGREALLYPWFEQLRVLSTFNGWVKQLSFSKTNDVGDCGSLWVADGNGYVTEFAVSVADSRGSSSFKSEGESWTFDSQVEKRGDTPLFKIAHDRAIIQIQYVADENLLISLAYDYCLRVYDTKISKCLHIIENQNGCAFTSFFYDSSHKDIFLADQYGYFTIYDSVTGKLTSCKRITKEAIKDLKYLEDISTVVLASENEVEFWKVNRDTDYKIVSSGHVGPVISIVTNKSSRSQQVMPSTLLSGSKSAEQEYRIFSASLDNTIRMWDPYDMCCTRVLKEDRSEISSITCLRSRSKIVSGHDDGSLRLWNLDTGSTTNLREHSNTVTCLVPAVFKGKDEELVLSGSFDGYICVWDMQKKPAKGIIPHMLTKFQASDHSDSEILCLIHDRTKNVIVSGGNDTYVRVWSEAYELLGTHEGHSEAVTCLALDANFLFSGSEDFSVKVWDTVPSRGDGVTTAFKGGSTLIKTLNGHKRTVTGVEIEPSSGYLLSCGMDGVLNIWDYLQGTVLKTFRHREELRCMVMRSDKSEVMVGTMQENILRFPLELEKLESEREQKEGNEGTLENEGAKD